jgi:hypothetical protein
MKVRHILLLLGMLLYMVSFFLTAATLYGPGAKPMSSMSGTECAILSLIASWSNLDSLPLLISGLINPVFLISIILLARNPKSKPGLVLKIALLFMLVAPLVYFYQGIDVRPYVGYFLWTTAMLMVLFNTAHLRILEDIWN